MSDRPFGSDRAFGLAFIGAGAVVEHRHLPGLTRTGQGRAVSVFDPNDTQARKVAEAFEIPHVASSLEDAIAADGVEAVVVASPNSFHREAVEAAAAAGKHIFCEKPIATNLRDARAICDAAEAAGVVLFLGFHHRFSAEHLCARRILDAGLIGDVRAFNSVTAEPIDTIPGGTSNYRFRPDEGGGLSLIDFGSHRIDQMRALLGEVEEVYLQMGSVLPTHNLDDSAVLSLKMKSGALGSLNFQRFSRAYLSPTILFGPQGTLCIAPLIVNPFQSAPVSLFAERSAVDLPSDLQDWTRPEGWWGEWPAGWVNLWPPRRNTFEAEFNSFFQSIRDGQSAEVNGEDGYRGLEIILAGHLSFHEHRPVRLPLDPDVDVPPPSFD